PARRRRSQSVPREDEGDGQGDRGRRRPPPLVDHRRARRRREERSRDVQRESRSSGDARNVRRSVESQETALMDARRGWTLAVAVGCAAYVAMLVWCGMTRVPYPSELEWMEGGMLTHAARVREGLPIYGKPSVEFVPF